MNFSDWLTLLKDGSDHAARTLYRSLHRAPSSAICWIPKEEELRKFFEAAAVSNGPLRGIPFGIKDLFDLPGSPTTASSQFLPSLRESKNQPSSIIQRFIDSGAIPAAKTTLNEFAYGLSGQNAHFGACPHPTFPNLLSGGSSSGSAWVVGSGLLPIAIGTDTGGSIRVPSAYCGLYGLRLRPGEFIDSATFPLSPLFDTVGWMTRNADDMATAIQALIPETSISPPKSPPGIYIGTGQCSVEIQTACTDTAQSIGFVLEADAQRNFEATCHDASRAFSIIQSYEAFQVHRSWIDSHKDQYDPKVWPLIDRGRRWSDKDLEWAQQKRVSVADFLHKLLAEFSAVALPATHTSAPRSEQLTATFRSNLLDLTTPASLAGLPVLTVPISLKDGLSAGIQIMLRNPKDAHTILERVPGLL